MNIPQRPFGYIKDLVEKLDLEVTYAHDDLIFVSHTLFIVKMLNVGADIEIFFNAECEPKKKHELQSAITKLWEPVGFNISFPSTFTIKPCDDKTLQITFLEPAPATQTKPGYDLN